MKLVTGMPKLLRMMKQPVLSNIQTVLDNPERLQTELHQTVLAIAATNKSNTLKIKKHYPRNNKHKNQDKNK